MRERLRRRPVQLLAAGLIGLILGAGGIAAVAALAADGPGQAGAGHGEREHSWYSDRSDDPAASTTEAAPTRKARGGSPSRTR